MKNKVVKYQSETGNQIACLITSFEENTHTNGFKISFRLYNTTECNGGFETTLWVSNATKETAKMFCGMKHEYQNAAKMLGATINSIKTDNKVGVKFQYNNVKNIL